MSRSHTTMTANHTAAMRVARAEKYGVIRRSNRITEAMAASAPTSRGPSSAPSGGNHRL